MHSRTKALARNWFIRVWNKKAATAIFALMHPSAVGLTEGGPIKGPQEFHSNVFVPLVAAFPDLRVRIKGIMADDNEAFVRWSVDATHSGPFLEIAASGRRVKFSGVTWLKFKKGKIIEGSDHYNFHGLINALSSGVGCTSVQVCPPNSA